MVLIGQKVGSETLLGMQKEGQSKGLLGAGSAMMGSNSGEQTKDLGLVLLSAGGILQCNMWLAGREHRAGDSALERMRHRVRHLGHSTVLYGTQDRKPSQ